MGTTILEKPAVCPACGEVHRRKTDFRWCDCCRKLRCKSCSSVAVVVRDGKFLCPRCLELYKAAKKALDWMR